MTLIINILLYILYFLYVSGLEIDPSSLSILKDVRSQIQFPKYNLEQRSQIIQQSQLLFTIYANRDLKMQLYGQQVDPIPRLYELSQKLSQMSDHQFHMSMFQIYSDLRDLHQTYSFPVPYACYRTIIPLQFSRVVSNQTHLYVVSKKFEEFTNVFGKGWLDKIHVGDVLSSVDGVAIDTWIKKNMAKFAGANMEGGYARAIEGLVYRSMTYRPLPERNAVTFGFLGQKGVYIQTLDYLTLTDEFCLSQKESISLKNNHSKLKKFSLDNAENDLGSEVNDIFGTPANLLDEMGAIELRKTSFESYSFTKIHKFWGTFGFLQLSNFRTSNPFERQDVINSLQYLLVNELKNTNGLIIDVRNNPGGSVQLAEGMAQLFASRNITPTSVRALNTNLNKLIFESGDEDFKGTAWENIFKTTPRNSTWTSPEIMLSDVNFVNGKGRAYFQPVAILTNAKCYSACELFVAAMQDYNEAVVYGEDTKTGGGGCNVMQNWNFHKYLPNTFNESLPGHQVLRLAWRQSLRTGSHDKMLIEETGVDVDQLLQPKKTDILGKSATQIDSITLELRKKNLGKSNSRLNIEGDLFRDVEIQKPIVFRGSAVKVSHIVATENGQAIGSATVSRWTKRWSLKIAAPKEFKKERRIFFEAFGADGDYLYRIERTIRVIPNSIPMIRRRRVLWQIHAMNEWKWDFKVGPCAAQYLMSDSIETIGWNTVNNNELLVPNPYKPGTHAVFSLFLNLQKLRHATLSLQIDMRLAEGDLLDFEVAKPPIPLGIDWFGSQRNTLLNTTLSFNLNKYCGNGIVEFRIIFKSRLDSNILENHGVAIRNVMMMVS